jgi:hypothetical protein
MFVTDWGTFIWKVMPFGMKNEPPTFQKIATKTYGVTKNHGSP